MGSVNTIILKVLDQKITGAVTPDLGKHPSLRAQAGGCRHGGGAVAAPLVKHFIDQDSTISSGYPGDVYREIHKRGSYPNNINHFETTSFMTFYFLSGRNTSAPFL
jgi:hypothetical protein